MNLNEARQRIPALANLNDQDAIDVLQQHYYPDIDKAQLAQALGVQTPQVDPPQAGVLRTAGDMGIKVAQGVVGLGQAAVGLGSLATGGLVGKGARALGYDPQRTKEILGEYLSDSQKASDAKVANADGFVDTIAASLSNPRALFGSVAESAPGMLGGMGVARAAAGKIAARAALAPTEGAAASAAELAAGRSAASAAQAALRTKAGAQAATDAVEAAGTRLMVTGSAVEGAQTAGQIADDAQAAGRSYGEYALPALAAGVGTAAIGVGAGKFMGDSATQLATGARSTGVRGSLPARIAKEALSEGVLEEMPQSAQEQVWTNAAMGEADLSKGVGNAAGAGLITGAAMGGGLGVLQGEAHHAPTPAPVQLPNTGPLSQAANAGQAATAAKAQANATVPQAPSPAQPSLQEIDDRMAALVAIGSGSLARKERDAAGNLVTIPAVAGRRLTTDEIAEYNRLKQLRTERTTLTPAQQAEFNQLLAAEQEQHNAKHAAAMAAAAEQRNKAEDAELASLMAQDERARQQAEAQQLADAIAASDARVAAGDARRAADKRADLRTGIINDAGIAVADRKQAFADRLRQEGYHSTALTDDDHADFDQAAAPLSSAPNELQDAVPERVAPPVATADTPNLRAVDDAIAAGMRLKTANGKVLHKPGSSKIFRLNSAQLAYYQEAINRPAVAQQAPAPSTAVPTVEPVSPAPEQTAASPMLANAPPIAPASDDGFDAAAHAAATSPHNDLPEPTPAQKEAGNYKVGHVRLHGLDLSIENPVGSVRRGVDRDGQAWESTMQHHYGYIKGTVGADKDHIDVFVGPNRDSDKAFVVDQVHPDSGKFDEHKIMLGFDSVEAARAGYQANYDASWTGGRNISETSIAGLKDWLASGKTRKPFTKLPSAAPAAEPMVAVTPPVSRQALNHLTVADMNDDQLLQARSVFAGHAREPKILRELVRRGLDASAAAPGAPAPAAVTQTDSATTSVEPDASGKLANATAPEHVQTGVDDRELGEIVAEFNEAQAEMMEGDHVVSNIFQPPAKRDIVRLADKAKGKLWNPVEVKAYNKDLAARDELEKEGQPVPAELAKRIRDFEAVYLPHVAKLQAEAQAEIGAWKAHAQAQGLDPETRRANGRKIVLSLFDLSGEWSKPWLEAGYQVYRFDIQDDPEVGDVNNFSSEFFSDWFGDFDGLDIYAILAATPCTDFAVSGARHFAAKDKDGRTVASVKLVHQTMRTIEYFKPVIWGIENPVGRIESLGGLPPWRLAFDPNHLGDSYTKKTLIWGRFNADLPVAPVEATEGSKMHKQYGGKSMATKNARSVTPEGFSYGFFMANNAVDHPVMAVANTFDRLDRDAIAEAMRAGVTEEEIRDAVQDLYYMDLDDDAANDAIRALTREHATEPDPDPSPTQPRGKQDDTVSAPDATLADKAGPAGDDAVATAARDDALQFSRRRIDTDDQLVNIYSQIAQDDAAFRLPDSQGKTLAAVVGDMAPGIVVDGDVEIDLTTADGPNADRVWRLRRGDGAGGDALVFRNTRNKQVWLNISNWKEGRSGHRIYQAIATWAHNTGQVFIGDPDGLSDKALYRRTEQMLSSALRHGTTEHLAPHARQVEDTRTHTGTPVRPIHWREGNDARNLRELLVSSYTNISAIFPEIERVHYNFATGQFERLPASVRAPEHDVLAHAAAGGERAAEEGVGRGSDRGAAGHGIARADEADGQFARVDAVPFTDEDFAALVREVRTAYEQFYPSSRGAYTPPVGVSDLKRAALTGTVLRAEGSDAGRTVLDHVAERLLQRVSIPLESLLYSRDAAYFRHDDAFAPPAIEQGDTVGDTPPAALAGHEYVQALKDTEQLNRRLAGEGMAPVKALRQAPTTQFAMARQIGKALGIRVQFVSGNGDFEGVATGGVAYLANDMRQPALAIAGHETLHALEQSNPALGERLRAQIRSYLKEGVVDDRQAREYAASGFQEVTERQAESEVLADINGAMWLDPGFWAALAKADRSLFRTVAYKFMEVATSLLASLRRGRFDVTQLVSDVDAVRNIMVATWAEHTRSRDALTQDTARRAVPVYAPALDGLVAPEQQLSTDALHQLADAVVAPLAHPPQIFVLDGPEFLDRHLVGAGEAPVSAGATIGGKIYLFRNGISSRDSAAATIWHELFHYGLRKLMTPDNYVSAMSKLYNIDPQVKAYADRWKATEDAATRHRSGVSVTDMHVLAVEEALAVMAEEQRNGKPVGTRYATESHIGRMLLWMVNTARSMGLDRVAEALRKLTRAQGQVFVESIFDRIAAGEREVEGAMASLDGRSINFRAADGARPATDSDNFRAWFGDSKVVDKDGEPLVVYHGTTRDFSTFDIGEPFGDKEAGAFFTADPGAASAYAHKEGGRVMPAFLRIEHPYVTTVEDWESGAASSVDAIKHEGRHDGYQVKGWSDAGDMWIAFEPEQIKSAIGNDGSFDGENPDIAFSRAGLAAALGKAAGNIENVRLPAGYLLGDLFNRSGKISWWHKSIGTMDNLARRQPLFAPVYRAVQGFLGDVSRYAVVAANKAPTLLPKLEKVADILGKDRKKPLTAEDTKAISAPIFEGTLVWARDAHGKPVKLAELEAWADGLTTAQKADILLQKGIIDDETNQAWLHSPLDHYDESINRRFTTTQLQAGVVWSDAELRELFQLDDRRIGLYREFRAALDQSLTNLTISEMVKLGGKDAEGTLDYAMAQPDLRGAAHYLRDHFVALAKLHPEKADWHLDTARQIMDLADRGQDLMDRGYAPLSRFGKHTVYVQQGGDQVYFGMFETPYEAARMARQMESEHPGADVSQGTVSEDAYKLFAGIAPETIELFGSMVGLDSQGDSAGSEVYQSYLKLAKNNRSAMKRMIERKGIAGFSEDAGRVLASFIYSNARLTSGNANLGKIDEAITTIPKQEGELTDAAMQLRETIRNSEGGNRLGGLMFAQFLGGSVASALVNLTQPVTMTLPYLSQYGGIGKAGQRLAGAIRDAGKRSTGDARLDAALQWAADEGIVAPQEVHYLQAQAAGKGALQSGDGTRVGNARAQLNNALAKVQLGWGKLFAMAEEANRRITFIAAYRTAIEEGKSDPARFAEEVVTQTQGTYNSGNRPKWARNPVGGVLMTFKQYSIGYLELLTRMAFAGPPGSPERAAGRRAALYMVAVLFLMAGADGLPFEQDLEDALDGVMQCLGYNFSTKRAKQEFLTGVLGAGGADFVLKGVSSMPGMPIDVAGRFGMGNLIPGTGLLTKKDSYTQDLGELVGPAGDVAKRTFAAAGKLLGGDVAGAALDMSPAAVRNAVKGADMLSTGHYSDGRGYKVNDTTPIEGVLKIVGFQPNSTANIQDAKGQALDMISQTRMRSKEIQEHWAQGILEGDASTIAEARAWRDDWNAKNPEAPVRVNMAAIAKRVRNMRQDVMNRTQKTAPAALKAAVRSELSETRG
jgi:hypothetical protein